MPDEITERVLHVIADAQRLPPEKVTVDKTFQELGIDSMDGVSLLFALENEFDINIPDEAAKSIRSVQDMVDGVKSILAHGGTLPPATEPASTAGKAPEVQDSLPGANEGAPVA
jgi:acyl carrier protein